MSSIAERMAEVVQELYARKPENQMRPRLEPTRLAVELMGNPQHAVLAELRSQWLNHDRFSLLWSCCLPSRAYCNDNPTFQEGVAASLGLPSPVCRPYVGLPIQTAARGTHRLDAYGKKLGALPLPGAARDYRHDELVYAACSSRPAVQRRPGCGGFGGRHCK